MAGQDEFAARLARIEAKHGRAPQNDTTADDAADIANPPEVQRPMARRRSGTGAKFLLPVVGLFLVAGAAGWMLADMEGSTPRTNTLLMSSDARKSSGGGFLEHVVRSNMSADEIEAIENDPEITRQLKGTRSEGSFVSRVILSN